MKRIRVLINSQSGLGGSLSALVRDIHEAWDAPAHAVSCQQSRSPEDGRNKVRQALAAGVKVILAVGGDGMVNSIGSELVDTGVALGVIPTGSGNGFARHFGIPLEVAAAARALRGAAARNIDVGVVDGHYFFVTCSVAWDAAIVRTFEKFPLRGFLPYLLAGAVELLEYRPQPLALTLDGEVLRLDKPLVCTAANLTQFGHGVGLTPRARADDGLLELAVIEQRDLPLALAHIPQLMQRAERDMPGVQTRRFRALEIRRRRSDPIQVDGEILPAGRKISISVRARALRVLVPDGPAARGAATSFPPA